MVSRQDTQWKGSYFLKWLRNDLPLLELVDHPIKPYDADENWQIAKNEVAHISYEN